MISTNESSRKATRIKEIFTRHAQELPALRNNPVARVMVLTQLSNMLASMSDAEVIQISVWIRAMASEMDTVEGASDL